MKPCNYDTEGFIFLYNEKDNSLHVKVKNADLMRSEIHPPYQFYFGLDSLGGWPSAVTITPLFADGVSPEQHIHEVSKFFMSWFRATHDSRRELEYGIKRFFALNSYDYLKLGPDQFARALAHQQEMYDGTCKGIEKLYLKRGGILNTLQNNFQDKGVHTARGTTVFDTREFVWVLMETSEQHPDKPEYLWTVRHFTPGFTLELGFLDFCDKFGSDKATNAQCVDYIMEEQKKRYGICPMDLDKVEFDIHRVHGVLSQLELILNIPFEKSVVPEPEENPEFETTS